jgi:hypothetical protein
MPGVPNTTDFTLADVIAAVLPSSNDLDECFTDAIQEAFNYTYNPGGNQNTNLLNFRDYGNNTAAQNQVYITPDEFNPTGACSTSRTVLVWKNNNPNSVQNGDKFWEDDNGSPGDPYPGGGAFQFFGAFTGLNSASFKLSSLGIASNVTFCSLPSLTLTDVYWYDDSTQNYVTPRDYYYSSDIGDASNLTIGDIIYKDSSLTVPLERRQPNQNILSGHGPAYLQEGSTGTTTFCGGDGAVGIFIITRGSVGVLQNIWCDVV